MARRRTPGPEDVALGAGGTFGFLRALWELNHALESASRSMKDRFGVTGPERLFVRVVGTRPGITPRDVARTLRLHPSSITAAIKRLEARRLIARRVNPSDARSFHLHLTPKGQRVDTLTEGTIEAGVREAIAASDPGDVATAAGLLVRVAQHLSSSMQRAARPARRRPAPTARRGRRPRVRASLATRRDRTVI